MSLTDFARSMLRRWYIVLVCLALTAGGAYAVSLSVRATYQSTATIVLLPPTSVVTDEGNPYLFMGGLDQALSVLAVKLNSAEVAETLVSGSESYTVEKDPRGPGPLINITASAATGPDSEALRDEILARLPNDLQALQAELGVASNSQIGAMTVVQSNKPTKIAKEQMRAMLGVAAAGIGMTIWVTGLTDRWLLTRAAKRREELEPDEREHDDREQDDRDQEGLGQQNRALEGRNKGRRKKRRPGKGRRTGPKELAVEPSDTDHSDSDGWHAEDSDLAADSNEPVEFVSSGQP